MIKVFEVIAIIITDEKKEKEDTKKVEDELSEAGDNLRGNGVLLTDLKIRVMEKK